MIDLDDMERSTRKSRCTIQFPLQMQQRWSVDLQDMSLVLKRRDLALAVLELPSTVLMAANKGQWQLMAVTELQDNKVEGL